MLSHDGTLDAKVFGWRCVFVEPMRAVGATASGLWASDGFDHLTPFLQARVLEVHPSCQYGLKPGDVIIVSPYSWEEGNWTGGTFYTMREENAHAVIDGFDEAAKCREADYGKTLVGT